MRKLFNLVKLGGRSAIDAMCASTGLPLAMNTASTLSVNKRSKSPKFTTSKAPEREVISSKETTTKPNPMREIVRPNKIYTSKN